MRLRRKPGAIDKILSEKELVVYNPYEFYGGWQQTFLKNQPIALEIGMGGGKFLTAHALKNPQFNYLGIEKQEELLFFALEKIKEFNLKNIKLLWFDAVAIEEIIAENEISHVYLNFSDPWPKKRHTKRRLTSEKFLLKYRTILQPGGILEFKTDNEALFEFSLNEFSKEGWKLEQNSTDLHKQGFFDGMMTEYEERFNLLGQKIYYLKAKNLK